MPRGANEKADELGLAARIASHGSELETLADHLVEGRMVDAAADLTGLAVNVCLGIGNPLPGKLIAMTLQKAFGPSAADQLLDRQIAADRADADRSRLLADIRDEVEVLLGQAILQIIHSHHRVGSEMERRLNAALGGLRDDRREFRDSFERLLAGAAPNAPVFQSRIPPAGALSFVGRASVLAQLDQQRASARPSLTVLTGPAGVGKTELAYHFARSHVDDYPGGMFRIRMQNGGPPADLASLALTAEGGEKRLALSLEDQCLAALGALGRSATLLVYDGAPSEGDLLAWLPGAGLPCDVVVTSTDSSWSPRFVVIDVPMFEPSEAHEIVRRLGGEEVDRLHGDALVRNAGGLAIQLCAATVVVSRALKRGRPTPEIDAFLATETRDSFRGVWDTIGPDARALLELASLFNPQQIPTTVLLERMTAHAGWTESRAGDALDDCMGYQILWPAGKDELRLHDLFARFVRGERHARTLPASVLRAHQDDLFEAARQVAEDPGAVEPRARLLGYPTSVNAWADDPAFAARLSIGSSTMGRALRALGRFSDGIGWLTRVADLEAEGAPDGATAGDALAAAEDVHAVGDCYWHLGNFAEARRWFSSAVDRKMKLGPEARLGDSLFMVGDCAWAEDDIAEALVCYRQAVRAYRRDAEVGTIDRVALGTSLHGMGNCHFQGGGDMDEALRLFHAALDEKLRGDRDGRPDHESTSKTMHQIGECHFENDEYEESLTWYQRSVTEGERGDRYGRVDRASIGISLAKMGAALLELGRLDAAADVLQRSADAKAAGDVHGRVDHDSLARTQNNLGLLLLRQGQPARAIACLESAVAASRKGDIFCRVKPRSVALSEAALQRARASLQTKTKEK